MARINPRYAPINRQERDKRENLIHPQKPNEVIKKMYDDFAKGIKKLQKQIKMAKQRKNLPGRANVWDNRRGVWKIIMGMI